MITSRILPLLYFKVRSPVRANQSCIKAEMWSRDKIGGNSRTSFSYFESAHQLAPTGLLTVSYHHALNSTFSFYPRITICGNYITNALLISPYLVKISLEDLLPDDIKGEDDTNQPSALDNAPSYQKSIIGLINNLILSTGVSPHTLAMIIARILPRVLVRKHSRMCDQTYFQ